MSKRNLFVTEIIVDESEEDNHCLTAIQREGIKNAFAKQSARHHFLTRGATWEAEEVRFIASKFSAFQTDMFFIYGKKEALLFKSAVFETHVYPHLWEPLGDLFETIIQDALRVRTCRVLEFRYEAIFFGSGADQSAQDHLFKRDAPVIPDMGPLFTLVRVADSGFDPTSDP